MKSSLRNQSYRVGWRERRAVQEKPSAWKQTLRRLAMSISVINGAAGDHETAGLGRLLFKTPRQVSQSCAMANDLASSHRLLGERILCQMGYM